eukprot:m.85218 g.85218  ORF g.85218 m.85218 type:complete len:57 (+) comp13001_c0_seq3:1136-1306(+)
MLALKDEWLRLVRAGGWERSMGQLDSVIESIGIKCVLVAIVIVYGVCRNYAINFAA